MKRFLFLIAILPVLALSKSTINERSLFVNTLKRWDVKVKDKRDLSERWRSLLRAKRSVDLTTSGVMLESLNRFAVNNEEEDAALTARIKRNTNLTLTMMNVMSEKARQKRDLNHYEGPLYTPTKMPDTFDYWEKVVGLTTPKNQLSCGSCWSFPTTGALEALYKKLTGELVSLSEQYFVDCTFTFDGCEGGLANDGFKVIKKTQWVPTEKDYPYTGRYSGGCPEWVEKDMESGTKNGIEKMLLQDWYPQANNEISFLAGLRYSPVAYHSDVTNNLRSYSGGDYEDVGCVKDPSSHVQLLVGYTKTTLRVRGSYGPTWGDGGYANYKRVDLLMSCNTFKTSFYITATERRDEEYAFCLDQKLGTQEECHQSCLSMNKDGEIGWDLAVIPTEMHNQRVFDMVNEAVPGIKADDKFRYLWIGFNDPLKHNNYVWSDGITPSNYVALRDSVVGKFGLFDKRTGKWLMKNSQTFKARGLCSRAATCWDISKAVKNGKVTLGTTGRIVEGTTAKITCDETFTLQAEGIEEGTNSITLRCTDGLWNNNDPLPTCDHDHDRNGEQDHDDSGHVEKKPEEIKQEEEKPDKEKPDLTIQEENVSDGKKKKRPRKERPQKERPQKEKKRKGRRRGQEEADVPAEQETTVKKTRKKNRKGVDTDLPN